MKRSLNALGLLTLACWVCGCAGSRREESLPPVAENRMEVSVIPEQQLKKGRPFFGFSASAPLPDRAAPEVGAGLSSDSLD